MASKYGRTLGALSIAAALALVSTACGDDKGSGGGAGSTPTAIASALESAGSEAKDALSSASAAASSKLAEIKGGLDATADATVGPIKADGDRTTAEVTVENKTGKTADYTLAVEFRDASGKLLDAIVMNIDNVEAGKQAKGTAKSNRKLTNPSKAEIGHAIRH
ncbi:hypothetical protein [Embleya scabrispora]|uniref:hypothetical protein n=1 Tax=Embleya scabrispora TaxID=159449 RepID=UPI000367C6B6|nr:hypothetical protein [Embleya scabrispora]